jgi:hypothetical protein
MPRIVPEAAEDFPSIPGGQNASQTTPRRYRTPRRRRSPSKLHLVQKQELYIRKRAAPPSNIKFYLLFWTLNTGFNDT